MGVVTVDIAIDRKNRKKRIKDEPNTSIATVIALDPGETTGWSLISVDPRALSDPAKHKVLSSIYEHQHGQVDSYRGTGKIPNEGECLMADDLCQLIAAWPHAAVIIEKFTIRINDRSHSFLSPVRLISKIEQHLWENNRTYFSQQPNDAKTTITDVRLKDWGMYEKEGGQGHARDADRHAVLFVRKATQSQQLRAQAFPHLFAEGAPYGPSARIAPTKTTRRRKAVS
jgi:hypothetical protein